MTNTSYPDGNVAWLTLSEPRLGAAATWVSGRGLVITGGSASGSGVEVINPTAGATTAAASGAPLAYPADPSSGSGATPLPGGQYVLLAGGLLPNGQDAGVRLIDLACGTACTPTWWTSLPIALATAQAFALSATSALVVGNEPGTGLTHAFVVSGPAGAAPTSDAAPSQGEASTLSDAMATSDAAIEDDAAGPGTAVEVLLPTNQDSDAAPPGALHYAQAIQSPVGTIAVLGGYPVLESFQPAP